MATQQKQGLPDFHVLIAAAGSGARMGQDIPKQYSQIHGKTVLRYSIEAFLNMPSCQSVRVIINPDDADLYHDAVSGLDLPEFIAGDKERNLSIYNGLKDFSNLKNEDIILIHDSARPCISQQDIEQFLSALKTHPAATLAAPVSSTLRVADNDNLAQEQVPRDGLWAIQTPQGFRYGDIMKAHENADPGQSYTDDTALASAIGIPVKLVKASTANIKITLPEDLQLAERLLKP